MPSTEELMFEELEQARKEAGVDDNTQANNDNDSSLTQEKEENNTQQTQQEGSTSDQDEGGAAAKEETTQESNQEQGQSDDVQQETHQEEQPPASEQATDTTQKQPTQEQQDTTTSKDEEAKNEEPFDVLEYYKQHKSDIELATRDLDSITYDDPESVADLLLEQYVSNGYTQEDAEVLLERKSPTAFMEDDQFDEDDPEMQKNLRGEIVEMKTAAKDYVSKLKERQAEIDLSTTATAPTGSSKDSVIDDYKAQLQQEQEQYVQQVQTNRANIAKDVIDNVSEIDIDLGDGNTVKYKVDEEDAKAFSNDILNIENFFTRFQKEDGSLNKEAFLLSYLAAQNPQKLAKVIKGFGEGEGRDKVIKNDFKNNTMQPKGKSTSSANREFTGDDHISKISRAAKDGKVDLSDAW